MHTLSLPAIFTFLGPEGEDPASWWTTVIGRHEEKYMSGFLTPIWTSVHVMRNWWSERTWLCPASSKHLFYLIGQESWGRESLGLSLWKLLLQTREQYPQRENTELIKQSQEITNEISHSQWQSLEEIITALSWPHLLWCCLGSCSSYTCSLQLAEKETDGTF